MIFVFPDTQIVPFCSWLTSAWSGVQVPGPPLPPPILHSRSTRCFHLPRRFFVEKPPPRTIFVPPHCWFASAFVPFLPHLLPRQECFNFSFLTCLFSVFANCQAFPSKPVQSLRIDRPLPCYFGGVLPQCFFRSSGLPSYSLPLVPFSF